jgi:hypothetical protein
MPGAAYALGVLTFINFINYLDRYLVPGALDPDRGRPRH